jgi:hypothetical protein
VLDFATKNHVNNILPKTGITLEQDKTKLIYTKHITEIPIVNYRISNDLQYNGNSYLNRVSRKYISCNNVVDSGDKEENKRYTARI